MRARARPCALVTQNSQPPNQKKKHKKAKAKEQAFSEDVFAPLEALEDYLAPSPDGMDLEQLLHGKALNEILEWLDESDESFKTPSR